MTEENICQNAMILQSCHYDRSMHNNNSFIIPSGATKARMGQTKCCSFKIDLKNGDDLHKQPQKLQLHETVPLKTILVFLQYVVFFGFFICLVFELAEKYPSIICAVLIVKRFLSNKILTHQNVCRLYQNHVWNFLSSIRCRLKRVISISLRTLRTLK